MKTRRGRLAGIAGAVALAMALAMTTAGPAAAQKSGGVLRVQHMDTPPSASIHEESTVSVAVPFMGVYNNLVLFDQHVPKTSLETVVPELATGWTWQEGGRQLVFQLRDGVRWHDGQPFTAKDVACTFDLLLSGESKLRRNPRGAWYTNVERVTADNDRQATFHLKAPQPSLLALLASGYTPIYPCHVPPDQMRRRPIGTGPYKLAEFKMNEGIKLVRNPDYWKKGLPYLDGIEFTIIPDRSTRMLSFIAGKYDMTFPSDVTVPLLKNIRAEAPKAQCTMRETGVSVNLVVNRDAPPFDNPSLRRALALSLDRKSFVDILSEGEDRLAGIMLPPPDGVWGLSPEQLKDLPGYGDVGKARDEARALMRQAGYGPDKRLKIKVSTRNIAPYKDPAVILIDQLKQVWVDGELEILDTPVYYNRVFKKDYVVALNLSGLAVDDPDVGFFETFGCGSLRNYGGYCDAEMTRRFEAQSRESDPAKRRQMVWDIDRELQKEIARPIIFYGRGAGCWHPQVRNLTLHVNSIYNNWRFEDVWLER